MKLMERRSLRVVQTAPDDVTTYGTQWPLNADTMIGMLRLENIEHCVTSIVNEDVPGDLIEAGVWRGGSTIFMRGLLKALGDEKRSVFVADSFEGLPRPSGRFDRDAADVHHTFDSLRVSLPEVKANFERYGLLDERVHFVKGWFADTLPELTDRSFAVVRLDGDMYESTMDGLQSLYPVLSPGGFLIVDDYGNPSTPGAKHAVDDYRREHDIEEPIQQIDWTGVYWRKSQG